MLIMTPKKQDKTLNWASTGKKTKQKNSRLNTGKKWSDNENDIQ